jgi:hypothetical protein
MNINFVIFGFRVVLCMHAHTEIFLNFQCYYSIRIKPYIDRYFEVLIKILYVCNRLID